MTEMQPYPDIGYDVRASSSECHAQIHRIQRLAARERPPTAGHFSPRATCRTRPGRARAPLWAYAQCEWASFARDTTHARSAGEKPGGIGAERFASIAAHALTNNSVRRELSSTRKAPSIGPAVVKLELLGHLR